MEESFEGTRYRAALLPVQFNELVRRRHDLSGEKRLLLAVLEDAILWYLKNPSPASYGQNREVREARCWVEARGDRGIFSYDTVCDFLGIDARRLRVALRGALRKGLPVAPLRRSRGPSSLRPSAKPSMAELAA